jgi:hypothetical protein
MKWGIDDIRIVGDIVVGSLLASGVRLVMVKAFLEPAAVYIGQRVYRRADDALGGALPDVFRGDQTPGSGSASSSNNERLPSG